MTDNEKLREHFNQLSPEEQLSILLFSDSMRDIMKSEKEKIIERIDDLSKRTNMRTIPDVELYRLNIDDLLNIEESLKYHLTYEYIIKRKDTSKRSRNDMYIFGVYNSCLIVAHDPDEALGKFLKLLQENQLIEQFYDVYNHDDLEVISCENITCGDKCNARKQFNTLSHKLYHPDTIISEELQYPTCSWDEFY